MIKWIKKRILKSIIKDLTKELPKYKEIAELYVDQHKDEVLEKVRNAIIEVIKNEVAKAFCK